MKKQTRKIKKIPPKKQHNKEEKASLCSELTSQSNGCIKSQLHTKQSYYLEIMSFWPNRDVFMIFRGSPHVIIASTTQPLRESSPIEEIYHLHLFLQNMLESKPSNI